MTFGHAVFGTKTNGDWPMIESGYVGERHADSYRAARAIHVSRTHARGPGMIAARNRCEPTEPGADGEGEAFAGAPGRGRRRGRLRCGCRPSLRQAPCSPGAARRRVGR